MRIKKGLLHVLKTPLLLGLALFLTSATAFAQGSKNHKPNLDPSEFTEKGIAQCWQEGQKVGDINVNDIFNKKFKLYDLLDKPVVVELWTLNSEQSKKNKKYLKAFYNQYNINILGICTDQYVFQIQDVNKEPALPWSNVQDNSKQFSGKTFAEANGLGEAKFLILLPGGIVHKVFYSEKDIGKVGVELQKYFKG